jgi:hypothetical protein
MRRNPRPRHNPRHPTNRNPLHVPSPPAFPATPSPFAPSAPAYRFARPAQLSNYLNFNRNPRRQKIAAPAFLTYGVFGRQTPPKFKPEITQCSLVYGWRPSPWPCRHPFRAARVAVAAATARLPWSGPSPFQGHARRVGLAPEPLVFRHRPVRCIRPLRPPRHLDRMALASAASFNRETTQEKGRMLLFGLQDRA